MFGLYEASTWAEVRGARCIDSYTADGESLVFWSLSAFGYETAGCTEWIGFGALGSLMG